MSRRDSQEPVALLTPEEQRDGEPKPETLDIEAGRAEPPKTQNLDHEYSVPSHVKFTWLGTYFFFSLLLTLYNKLVLGMVSRHPLLSNTASGWGAFNPGTLPRAAWTFGSGFKP